jgi:hypothetical protein
MTTIQFTPSSLTPFQFQANLSGPTVNVTSTATTFNVTALWNTFGQRWYIQITDQNVALVLNRPLVASPPGYPINLVAGYFSGSSLVFLESTQQFVVTP